MSALRLFALCCLLTTVVLGAPQFADADMQYWLDDVPDYQWYNGCSPTAGGQLIGYWDNQPGYENLWDGTAPTGPETHDHPIYDMIASPEHIDQTYNPDECTHTNAPNSVSCFMHTDPDTGGSYTWNIGAGMNQYAAWDDPATSLNETAYFTSFFYSTPRAGWDSLWKQAAFQYEDLVREIDAGRPLLLNLSLANGVGHTVSAYGYWVDDNDDRWFAVRDTWQNGISDDPVRGITAVGDSGHEWWRYDLQQTPESGGDEYYVGSAVPFIPNDDGPIFEEEDFGNGPGDALTVESDAEMIYANLADSDQDWYRVWLEEGQRINVSTQDTEGFDGAIDTYMELLKYDGEWLGLTWSENLSPATNTSSIFWKARQDDWHYFGVMAGETVGAPRTGDYALSWYTAEAPEPATTFLLSLGIAGIIARRRWRRAA